MPITVTTSITNANSANISIRTTEPTTLVAPCGVFFEAFNASGFTGLSTAPTGTGYSPEWHEITYIWTVNGSPLSAFTAPGNMVTGWNAPNTAYGPKVAFCFPSAATYTIDLWCVGPNGETAEASTTVTVQDPDTVFSGTNTIAYDATSTFSGKPTGAQEVTSWAALETAIGNASSPVRVVFPKGQTITPTSQILINATGDYLNYIGAYGTGAKPILDTTSMLGTEIFYYAGSGGGTISNSTEYVCINGLKFQGGWEANNQVGIPGGMPFQFRDERGDTFVTMYDCEWTGLDNFEMHHSQPQDADVRFVIANCSGTNWRNYGLYGNGIDTAIIGCAFYQHVDAYNGGPLTQDVDGARNGITNAHGPYRQPGPDGGFTYIAMSDFFSRNGWSFKSPDNADQAALRLNQSGNDSYINMERCVVEGGLAPIALTTEQVSFTEEPGNHIFDKVLTIGTVKTYEGFFFLENGGATVRNCIGYIANKLSYQSDWKGAIQTRSQAPSTYNLAGPVRIFGNSFYNARNTTNDPAQTWGLLTETDAFTNVTTNNNIVYAPNIDTPVTLPDSDIDVSTSTIPGVTLRYKGVSIYPAEGIIKGTLGSNVGGSGGSFTVPYPSGTTQSTWTTRESAGDTQHAINIGGEGGSNYFVDNSTLAITFGASNITVTNNSGSTWTSGASFFLRLDLSSDKPAFSSTYAQNGESVPLPFPATGSTALDPGTGLFPYDDFDSPGTSRGADPDAGAKQVT